MRKRGRDPKNAVQERNFTLEPFRFVAGKNSFTLGDYEYHPYAVTSYPKGDGIPAGFFEAFFSPIVDTVIFYQIRPIDTGVLVRFIEKSEANMKVRLAALADTTKYEATVLQNKIMAMEELKNYLSNGGVLWSMEWELWYRIASEEMKDTAQFEAYKDVVAEGERRLVAMGFRLRKKVLGMKSYLAKLLPFNQYVIPALSGKSDAPVFTTENVAAMFPGVWGIRREFSGEIYGISMTNYQPIIVDRFSKESYHMVVIAQTGSGKSFFVKLLMLRYMLTHASHKVYIMDPLGEYSDMAVKLNGEVVDMVGRVINPLDLNTTVSDSNRQGSVIEKVNVVLQMFSAILKDLTDQDRSLISEALTNLYSRTREPTFSDLLEELKKFVSDERQMRRLLDMMNIFVTGSLSNLNRKSNINVMSDIIVFDLSKTMSPALRSFYLYFMVDFLKGRISGDYNQKLLFIDEAQYFTMYQETASFLDNFIRHARHYNCGITLITQNISDFYSEMGGDFSVGILNNAYSVVVLHNKVVPDRFVKEHALTPEDVRFITVEAGQRVMPNGERVSLALFLERNKRRERMIIKATPLEAALISTDPNYLKKVRESGGVAR